MYRQETTFATQHEMRLSYGFGLKGTRWWAEYLEPIPGSHQVAPDQEGVVDNWPSPYFQNRIQILFVDQLNFRPCLFGHPYQQVYVI